MPSYGRALRIWGGSRLATIVLTFGGAVAMDGKALGLDGFFGRWQKWDADLFLNIARFGYFSDAFHSDNSWVFFPGTPLLVRAVHVVTGHWMLAALVVSAVAGGIGCLALWRLAAEEGGPAAGDAAVLALVTMPYAVFLFAGYSEPVFLAFAATAWLAARHGRWRNAGLLATGAALARVTAVPLVAGLGVLYLTRNRTGGGRRLDRDVLWLALPVLAIGGYLGYLRARTGRWDAYTHALEEGWGRRTVSPLAALRTTWAQASNDHQAANYLWSWRAEIAALAIGVVLVVVLLRLGRWGEATYVGSNAAMLSVSSFYASNARGLLVWFPLYVLLGGAFARRPGLLQAYLWVCAPLAGILTVAFTRGAWVG